MYIFFANIWMMDWFIKHIHMYKCHHIYITFKKPRCKLVPARWMISILIWQNNKSENDKCSYTVVVVVVIFVCRSELLLNFTAHFNSLLGGGGGMHNCCQVSIYTTRSRRLLYIKRFVYLFIFFLCFRSFPLLIERVWLWKINHFIMYAVALVFVFI